MISSDVFKEYIKNRLNMILSFNKKAKSSIKFGMNHTIKVLEKSMCSDLNSNPPLIFIFYDENLDNLYDLLVLKATKARIYFLDYSFLSDFLEIFKIRRLLSFSIVNNDSVNQVYSDIIDKLKPFEVNSESLKKLFDKDKIMNVISSERAEKEKKEKKTR